MITYVYTDTKEHGFFYFFLSVFRPIRVYKDLAVALPREFYLCILGALRG